MEPRVRFEEMAKRPRGRVEYWVHRHGELLYHAEIKNLFVNAGLPALASLIGGDTAGEFASAIGFGSGATAPTIADTALTTPAYYKAIDSHAENGSSPGAGSAQFNWSLVSGTDTGAYGITIQELGLFANPTSVALPGTAAPTILLARRTIAPIAYASGMNISGSWMLTF